MNVARFAGENKIFQKMAEQMAANDQAMKRQQQQTLAAVYEQRARDIAATGVSGAGRFL